MIKDSGNRTEFDTGAVRDIQEGKGRFDLIPISELLDGIFFKQNKCADPVIANIGNYQRTRDLYFIAAAMDNVIRICFDGDIYYTLTELSHHFEEGALKYSENNWKKGIPVDRYIDSALRHYCKFKMNITDEHHDRACLWNLLCCYWTIKNIPEE